MVISDKTLAFCNAIVANPSLFQETDAFSKAIQKVASDALTSRKDLIQLQAFWTAVKDETFFGEIVGALADSQLKSVLKQIDKHWPSKDVHREDLRKRIVTLSNGQASTAEDPRKRAKLLKSHAADLSKAVKLSKAIEIALTLGEDLSPVLKTMTGAQSKKLLKTCDPGNKATYNASLDQITDHLTALLAEKVKPLSQEKSTKARSGSKGQPSNPMESVAMGAKWDGIDRD